MQRLGSPPWRRPSSGIAVSGTSVLALKTTKDGARTEMRELPDGLVAPAPATPNIQSMRDLATLAGETLSAVGAEKEPLAVALPDLALSTVVYPPRRAETHKVGRRAFRESLPYGAGEARCDFWTGGRGELLAAAVREVVVQQYEQVVEAANCRLGWVDGTSLSKIPEWSAVASKTAGLVVTVQLYRAHYCLSVFKDGALADLRTKLRESGAVELVCSEVRRAPAFHRSDDITLLGLSGDGASEVAAAFDGEPGVGEVRVEATDEAAHVESALRSLLDRGSP